MSKQIYILDTTLRDGQQSPGAGMSFKENLDYAEIAHKLKIDILEAGFPSASNSDFEIVHQIAKDMAAVKSSMKISALCQLREAQIYKTMEALAPSLKNNKAVLHTYVPVDPNLMPASLGSLADNKPLIVETVYKLIKIATSSGYEVEFSSEGYSRMGENFDFTTDVIRAALNAGAKIINCPDTIGGASPYEGDNYFVHKIKQHAEIFKKEMPNREIIWSVHCHNDLGTALENTLSAVFSGIATQIEGCINGVGERAGNVSLEQCIMNIRQFGQLPHAKYPIHTNINIAHLKEASDFIDSRMLPRQPHFPITGKNAALHTSGGHTNAILNNPLSYQPFDPSDVGSEISFVFSPLSGSNHAQQIIHETGYICGDEEKTIITQSIKDMYSDRRKGITNEELIEAYRMHRFPIKINHFTYHKDSDTATTVVLEGKFFDQDNLTINYKGKGSALSALNDEVIKHLNGVKVEDYNSRSESSGINALCRSNIIISVNSQTRYTGTAVDDNIETSAIKAFIDAVNTAYLDIHFRHNK